MTYQKDPLLKVTIRRPEQVEWEGHAWAISSTNAVGPFDVLPEHTQYVGLISEYVIVHTPSEDKRFSIGEALMKVADNGVEIWIKE
jgi:F0F1-type ATP synthase epsilon subunit